MISTKFAPFDRDILFDLGGMSPEEQSKAFAAFARQEIAIADAQNERALGRAVSYETIVDGRRGASLESVSPNGVIVANFDLGSNVVEWIWAMLMQRSPVRSGSFKKWMLVYADGAEVDDPENIPPDAQEIVILSAVPYARKIEGGSSKQAPEGVFEALAAMAAQRYGNQARIRFSYRSPIGGGTPLAKWAAGNAAKAGRKHRQQFAKNTRQPAIIIQFR